MYRVEDVMEIALHNGACIKGKYVPCRPIPFNKGSLFSFIRLKDAWEVFRGRADAISWTEQ
jgi:hypothetical protein